MTDELLPRLLWTISLIVSGLGLFHLFNRMLLLRAQRAQRVQKQSVKRPALPFGRPSLMYFTTPDCAPCKTVQRPAIRTVQQTLGERLEIIEINAYEQPDLARQWGVMSVPTTFIVDAAGKPRHVNHGVTPAVRLLAQLKEVL